ncbi:MAG: glycosyltransferase family 2 protein [Lachnospiraceae bacterium]|nr:glycosyltransferase family 2 protein [Lachnospiraceae bacterium]
MAKTEDKISIIIITYNMGKFIGRALNSLQNQTCPNFEVIVVDNHSQDETEEIVNAVRDMDIRLIKVHNNGILSVSRNCGMEKAHGNWIGFLDADDFWAEDRVERLYEEIAAHGNDKDIVAYSNDFIEWDIQKNKKRVCTCGTTAAGREEQHRELVLHKNFMTLSGTLVRKDALLAVGMFDEAEQLKTVEDYDLWIKLTTYGKIVFIHEPLCTIVLHEGNYSKKANIQMEALRYLKQKYLDDSRWTEEEREAAWNGYALLAMRCLQKNGFFKEAKKIWREYRCLSLKACIILLLSCLHITK